MANIAPAAPIVVFPPVVPMDLVPAAAPAALALDTQITCALKAREILETANARGPRYQTRGSEGIMGEIQDLSANPNYDQYTKLFVAALLGTNPGWYEVCKSLIETRPFLQNSTYVIKALFLAARNVNITTLRKLCARHMEWEPPAQQLVDFLGLVPAGPLKWKRLAELRPTDLSGLNHLINKYGLQAIQAITQQPQATTLEQVLKMDPDALRDRIMVNDFWEPEEAYNDPLNRFIAICRDATRLPPRTPLPISDPSFLAAAAQGNGLFLKLATGELQNVLRIVEIATDQNGEAFWFASPELRANRELAMRVVGHWGSALGSVADALKDDDEVILIAVKEHGAAIGHTAANFYNDKVRVKRLLNSSGCGWKLVEYLPGDSVLFADEDFKSSAMRYAPATAARMVWRTPPHEGEEGAV